MNTISCILQHLCHPQRAADEHTISCFLQYLCHPKKKEKNKNKRWRTRSLAVHNTCHPKGKKPLTSAISCCLQHLCHPEKKNTDEHTLLAVYNTSVTRKRKRKKRWRTQSLAVYNTSVTRKKPLTNTVSCRLQHLSVTRKKPLTNTIFCCLQHLCQPKKAADEHNHLLYSTSVPQKPPLTNTISCCLQSRVYNAILQGSVGWVGSVLHPLLYLQLDVIGAAVVIRGSDVAVRDVIGLLLIRRFIRVARPFIPGEIRRLGGREIIFLEREINYNVIKQKHLEARIRPPPPPVTITPLVTDHFREVSHHWGQPSRKLCWPTGRRGQNNNNKTENLEICIKTASRIIW